MGDQMLLSPFLVPIGTGTTPAAGGRLSRERAAELNDRIRQLRNHRRRAEAEIRGYLIRGADHG